MLTLTIPDAEWYDEKKEEFCKIKGATIQLEHSLIAIAKWEAKWHKAFLSDTKKSDEETLDYIRCMTITQHVDPLLYDRLSIENLEKIRAYIEDPMTATWFKDEHKGKRNSETVTAELIYYWMIALNIPIEFEKWHLNRLLTLIHVCEIKNSPGKKMPKSEIYSRNKALNEARRKAHHSKG